MAHRWYVLLLLGHSGRQTYIVLTEDYQSRSDIVIDVVVCIGLLINHQSCWHAMSNSGVTTTICTLTFVR